MNGTKQAGLSVARASGPRPAAARPGRAAALVLICRLVVGGAFIYAGILKMLGPVEFADAIASFQLVPDVWIGLVALGLPPLEVVAGAMLIIGCQVRMAALTILGMTVVFAAALIQALARGLEVDCGCFGAGDSSVASMWLSLGRDLVLMLLVGFVYVKSLGTQVTLRRESGGME